MLVRRIGFSAAVVGRRLICGLPKPVGSLGVMRYGQQQQTRALGGVSVLMESSRPVFFGEQRRYESTEQKSQMVMPEGLKKFFPDSDAWAEMDVGRRWKAKELRVKSDEDLHKLWYVLLFEQNKLLTVKLEGRRVGEELPSPLRLKKVKQSMIGIKQVLRERRDARRQALITDFERWRELRVAEGLEPHSLVYAREDRRPLSEKEEEQNLGIMPPHRARPGQPQRPMKKKFRTIFRKQLDAAKIEQAEKEAQEYTKELKNMDDERVRLELDAVAQELVNGADLHTLSAKAKACLKVARSRGLSPI
eukprot:m.30983 g.30983  ORF g.30983 m.30983 type:complete len:305 (-) comp6266_c0_seq1:40-954(-)